MLSGSGNGMVSNTTRILHQAQRGVNEFSQLMKLKLNANVDKGLWNNETYEYLRGRINIELKELDDAIAAKDYVNAELECADVANFCMMISDNLNYERFKEFNGEKK
jgi:hypothetical protein